jgi:hypothetical protein
MSSNTTTGTAKFERMTKEEKLRFCQDLIKQAANLAKSSAISGIRSTGSKTNARSKSKSSKRPASASGTMSKKTKSGTLNHSGKSKSYGKSSTLKKSASASSVKSSTSKTVYYFICSVFFIYMYPSYLVTKIEIWNSKTVQFKISISINSIVYE